MHRTPRALLIVAVLHILNACAQGQPGSATQTVSGSASISQSRETSVSLSEETTVFTTEATTRANNPGPDLSRLDFWTLLSGVAANPVLGTPTTLKQLSAASLLIVSGTVVGVRPRTDSDSGPPTVVLEIQGDDGTTVSVVVFYPVEVGEQDLESITRKLPKERAAFFLWHSSEAKDVGKPYACTQTYFCAFVESDGGVRNALEPEFDLYLNWPDMAGIRTLDQLVERAKEST